MNNQCVHWISRATVLYRQVQGVGPQFFVRINISGYLFVNLGTTGGFDVHFHGRFRHDSKEIKGDADITQMIYHLFMPVFFRKDVYIRIPKPEPVHNGKISLIGTIRIPVGIGSKICLLFCFCLEKSFTQINKSGYG